jgi:membrane-anchored protein YejM (alkaline phosphatase superfamily)
MNRIFIPAVLMSILLILSLIYLINQGLDLAAIIFASGVLVLLMLASYVYQQIRLSVRECIKESTK